MRMIDRFLLPDRYEGLETYINQNDIPKIIIPVEYGIEKIEELYEEMGSSGRGSFLILKGKSGCGKTTFLKTLNIFLEDVETETITNDMDLVESINKLDVSNKSMRIVIVEGRESIIDSSNSEINNAIHTINRFIRSKKGKNTLIVWPCNNDDIIEVLVDTSQIIGGTSLLGLEETYFDFSGPEKSDYIKIAKQTVELLNNGKTILDFGIGDNEANSIINEVSTIGEYLKKINKLITKNKKTVRQLSKKENCKMWVIVLAANEPSKDVEALTKGEFLDADIQRLMVSTNANIVEDLKKYPQHIGLLANYLDCKIIYMPIVTALSIVRTYASDSLIDIMKKKNMGTQKDIDIENRVLNTELVRMIRLDSKLKGIGGKTGPNSIVAFEKLTDIASKNDRILNATFGEALKCQGIIDEYKLEQNFGEGLTRRTDLLCKIGSENLRLEFMWRKKTSKAEISNYTLTKIYNYGKALGFLE